MAFTVVQYKRFVQAQSPTAWASLYTVPNATQDVLKGVDLVNTTAGAVTVSVCIVPSGGAPGAANALFFNLSIPANGNQHWSGTQVMNAGDSIYMQGSVANAVTLTASGLEST